MQLLLLTQFTYDWNDSWVMEGNQLLDQTLCGNHYLLGLVTVSLAVFLMSFVGIVLILVYFPSFNPFTAITMVLCVLA